VCAFVRRGGTAALLTLCGSGVMPFRRPALPAVTDGSWSAGGGAHVDAARGRARRLFQSTVDVLVTGGRDRRRSARCGRALAIRRTNTVGVGRVV